MGWDARRHNLALPYAYLRGYSDVKELLVLKLNVSLSLQLGFHRGYCLKSSRLAGAGPGSRADCGWEDGCKAGYPRPIRLAPPLALDHCRRGACHLRHPESSLRSQMHGSRVLSRVPGVTSSGRSLSKDTVAPQSFLTWNRNRGTCPSSWHCSQSLVINKQ